MKSLHFYQELAERMVRRDAEKDRMLAAMEAMWQARWRLPEALSNLQ